MITVYKYELNVYGNIQITLPKYSNILYSAIQNNVVCMWVELNIKNKNEVREFMLLKTGDMFTRKTFYEYEYIHLNTFILNNNLEVHLFELKKCYMPLFQ